jgi:hypothetical protein
MGGDYSHDERDAAQNERVRRAAAKAAGRAWARLLVSKIGEQTFAQEKKEVKRSGWVEKQWGPVVVALAKAKKAVKR